MPTNLIRLPAEWEHQDGVLLAWPTPDSDWGEYLGAIETVFIQLTALISTYERVILICHDLDNIRAKLIGSSANLKNINFIAIAINDTWMRDCGPIGVTLNNQVLLYDFGFNGWGLKFAADLDNQINRQLQRIRTFRCPMKTLGLVLEGGSIESDGAGTLLTTSKCLLSPNRNPHLNKIELEKTFSNLFGTKQVLWLDYGFLAGDDTDSHVDTLARLCPDNTIIYTSCDDETDEHFAELKKMEQQLKSFTTLDDKPFKLFPLPIPEAKFDNNKNRLPATYANFLIINGAVLVPVYDDPADSVALCTIQQIFPTHKIIAINCNTVIVQHGSLHCLTMQLTQGTLS
ncbi:MAG: agmatine deiminase [Desulfobacteraceae bacterium 4572_35.1]|nr:MAG: agmatine deiminase [Desulfobacteraceae bacterium 4572_35.1]